MQHECKITVLETKVFPNLKELRIRRIKIQGWMIRIDTLI